MYNCLNADITCEMPPCRRAAPVASSRRVTGACSSPPAVAPSALAVTCRGCAIDIEPRKNERPSDHAPVTADFAIA